MNINDGWFDGGLNSSFSSKGNFKLLAFFCNCTGCLMSNLVIYPEDPFSHHSSCDKIFFLNFRMDHFPSVMTMIMTTMLPTPPPTQDISLASISDWTYLTRSFSGSWVCARISLNNAVSDMSLIKGKPNFCICENKDADQLCSNCTADQHLCFRCTDSTMPLLLNTN